MGSKILTKISEIAEVFDGPHATPEKIDFGPYFLSISSLENGQLDLSKSARLSEEQFSIWTRRVQPQEGDLLFSYETRLGEAALMPADVKACLGRRMGLLRPDRSKVLPEYLLYAYLSPDFQQEIKRRTIHGATVDRISLKELPDFNIYIPPLDQQYKTANFLKGLNQKITLNRQINQTLEQMAQTLFKSWFVDFDPVIDNALDAGNDIPDTLQERAEQRRLLRAKADFKPLPAETRALFPSEFEETELGWVPKGWELLPISEAIVINPSVKLTKGSSAKFADMKALPTTGYAIEGIEIKPYAGGAKFQKDDVLLARITPCLENGKTGFVDFLNEDEVGFGSTEFIVMRQTEKVHFGYVACLARNSHFRAHAVQSMVGSSGRQRVQNSCFDDYVIAVPTQSVMHVFAELSESTFNKTKNNNLEITALNQLRDNLLPKLISGELALDDLPEDVAEAAEAL
jgi:type I restriction enzyme S subunit